MLLLTSCANKSNKDVTDTEVTTYTTLQEMIVPEVVERDETISGHSFIYPKINYLVNKDTEVETNNICTDLDLNNKLYPYSYYYFRDDDNLHKAYLDLYNGIYNMSDSIRFDDCKITKEDLNTLLCAMIFDNPDFYYIRADGDWEVACDEDGIVVFVNLNYVYSKELINNNNRILEDSLEEIKQHIPKDLSRYDLYVWLHDFVIYNIAYRNDTTGIYGDVTAGLIDRHGTCNAFTMTYVYLCRGLGIQTACVRGNAGDVHSWNVVPYGENWMFVDCTMDNIDSDANDWCKHGLFGYSNKYVTDVLEYVIYEEDSGLNYCPYPKCTDETLLYKDKCGYNYTLESSDNCLQKVEDLLVNSIDVYDKSYIEVFANNKEVYKEICDTKINSGNKEFFDMLNNVKQRVTTHSVDLNQVGLSNEGWNNSFVIYVFTENKE